MTDIAQREKDRLRAREYYYRKLDQCRQRARDRYWRHHTEIRRRSTEWNRTHAAEIAERKRIAREKGQEREWRKKNPRSPRESRLKYQYGITLADYERMLTDQGGVCWICGMANPQKNRWGETPVALHVDHCEATKKVRGLLCYRCNTGIGLLRHDVNIIKRAIDYLSR